MHIPVKAFYCHWGTIHVGTVSLVKLPVFLSANPVSKIHGANMGPIWGRQDPGGPHVGPMKFSIWEGTILTFFIYAMFANNTYDTKVYVNVTLMEMEYDYHI